MYFASSSFSLPKLLLLSLASHLLVATAMPLPQGTTSKTVVLPDLNPISTTPQSHKDHTLTAIALPGLLDATDAVAAAEVAHVPVKGEVISTDVNACSIPRGSEPAAASDSEISCVF
ncbi:hypothetical protein QBC42DRAFT_266260 [Cladorrhinum samala]|uniref:Uncharacterized protein n=1 Tax=Cladorrhinum samala TaxID=585594 RepID=A0AAV9HQY3_9PEZI|nr:hypothetical protein QBC42DRAFT_266260 [Cladorrhinum samala]